MKYTHLFFDLDGTLIDSKPGIINSLNLTMDALKVSEAERPPDLNAFIGPPLRDSFRMLFGFDNQQAEHATKVYRGYYTAQGINEFTVFPGIPEVLASLHKHGLNLSLVTSKAEVYAVKLIERTGMTGLFDWISGCELSGKRSEKAELIEYTLDRLGLKPSRDILMIGDRSHDLRGARIAGVSGAGVLYGYGSEAELSAEKPDLLFKTTEQLLNLLYAV